MAKDLVCGMDVNEKSDSITAEHNGVKYFFCAQVCKDEFLKSPDKYISAETNKAAGCSCCDGGHSKLVNESAVDRVIRGVVGVIFLVWGISSGSLWLKSAGSILLVTAITGFCLIYAVLGIRTNCR